MRFPVAAASLSLPLLFSVHQGHFSLVHPLWLWLHCSTKIIPPKNLFQLRPSEKFTTASWLCSRNYAENFFLQLKQSWLKLYKSVHGTQCFWHFTFWKHIHIFKQYLVWCLQDTLSNICSLCWIVDETCIALSNSKSHHCTMIICVRSNWMHVWVAISGGKVQRILNC